MSKRELIEPHKGDKRYVRRGAKGQFKETDDVGTSLARDRKRKAKTVAPKGQGDRGDQEARLARRVRGASIKSWRTPLNDG